MFKTLFVRLMMILVASTMTSSPIFAKDNYIKLSKRIIYYGEAINKKPEGSGKLSLRQEDKEDLFITGDFKDTVIYNANFNNYFISKQITYRIYEDEDGYPCIKFQLSDISNRFWIRSLSTKKSPIVQNKYTILLRYEPHYSRKEWRIKQCPDYTIRCDWVEPLGAASFWEIFKYRINSKHGEIKIDREVRRERRYDYGECCWNDEDNEVYYSLKAKDGSIWSGSISIYHWEELQKRTNLKEYYFKSASIVFSDGRKYNGKISEWQGRANVNVLDIFKTQPDNFNTIKFEEGTLVDATGKEIKYEKGKIKKKHAGLVAEPDSERSNYVFDVGWRIYHRDYKNDIVDSDIDEIQMLLNEDVAGYYKISGVSTEVQRKVFAQSDDYKNIYLPRLNKEKEYLMQDEYDLITGIPKSDYDLKSHRFFFEMEDYPETRYKLSNETHTFYVLNEKGSNMYCLSYPKSLVSVQNYRYDNGPMHQKQTLYSCVVSETEAAKFDPENTNYLMMWRFKIENVKKGKIYGKTTKIAIINRDNEIVCDLSETLKAKGSNFKKVEFKNIKLPKVRERGPQRVKCWDCYGTGVQSNWNTGAKRICVGCGGKGWRIE